MQWRESQLVLDTASVNGITPVVARPVLTPFDETCRLPSVRGWRVRESLRQVCIRREPPFNLHANRLNNINVGPLFVAGIGQRVKHDDFVLRILIHPVLHEISTNKPGATGYE